MNKNKKIESIILNDLCIACGACVSACPFENLKPAYNEYRGAKEVSFQDKYDCHKCEAPCVNVCPSIEINYAQINAQKYEKPNRDGWVKDVKLGYSDNYRDDGKSSSGGVLRALVRYSLGKKVPVLTLLKDNATSDYLLSVLTKESDIDNMPGSIYHSTSFDGAIDYLREVERSCIIVAIPCQLAGLYSYIANIEPELRNKIKLTYGLVCGWMYSDHSYKSFLSHKKLDIRPTEISYRGDGKVGSLKITHNNKTHMYDRRSFLNKSSEVDYKSSYSTEMNRLRCRVCEDHLNMLADIVTGDAWLERKKDEKLSIIITRTARGQALLSKLIEDNLINVEEASFEDLIESQSKNLIYGDTAKKISAILEKKGIITPKYLFNDSSESNIKTSYLDKINYELELILRKIIRKKRYKTYWWIYFIRNNMRKIKSSLLKRIFFRSIVTK